MSTLTLEQASAIVDATLAKGHELGLNPLTAAVLDAGGHLVAFKREDNSSIMRPEIAMGKAWASLAMGMPSRNFEENLAPGRPTFVNALAAASQGRIMPVPGGVLIRNDEGAIIGAVGVSGDTSDQDERCAIVGVQAAGLASEPAA